MSRGSFFIGLAVVVLLIVGLVSWRLTTNTGDDANAELPSDLTEIFNTAVVERADVVADEAELVGELRYQDAVDLVHRVDVVITTVTTEVEVPVLTQPAAAQPASGGGRGGQPAAVETPAEPVIETIIETVTETVETPGQRTVTGLPRPGSVISPGDVLYETDSTPVFAALGEVAAWRTLDSTSSGDDVAQLQQHLLDGGWATEPFADSGVWDTALTTAVQAWQTDTGQAATGVIALGDLWFIAGPIRITNVQATEGVIVADGDPILSYTSSERAIEASVAEIPEGLLSADVLRVRLPGVGEVPATLRSTSGTDTGFDLVLDVESTDGIPETDGIDATVSWTTSEIVDALTLPPEALRRVDTGEYTADVLVGDTIERTPVEVVGQAGRLVAIEGLDERTRVLIP